jgi:hypothetical protein
MESYVTVPFIWDLAEEHLDTIYYYSNTIITHKRNILPIR